MKITWPLFFRTRCSTIRITVVIFKIANVGPLRRVVSKHLNADKSPSLILLMSDCLPASQWWTLQQRFITSTDYVILYHLSCLSEICMIKTKLANNELSLAKKLVTDDSTICAHLFLNLSCLVSIWCEKSCKNLTKNRRKSLRSEPTSSCRRTDAIVMATTLWRHRATRLNVEWAHGIAIWNVIWQQRKRKYSVSGR